MAKFVTFLVCFCACREFGRQVIGAWAMSSSTNIAYNKTAFQPEDWDHIKCGFLTADKAVDGVADMIMRNCFCASLPNTATHTNWWSVDLALKYNVDRLVVYSRESPGVARRLNYFLAGLTDKSPANVTPVVGEYALCVVCPDVVRKKGDFQKLKCNALLPAFRFVIIQKNPGNLQQGPITLCEVQVYAVAEDRSNQYMIKKAPGQRLLGSTFKQVNLKYWIHCLQECTNSNCQSFNHNVPLALCQLNSHLNGMDFSAIIVQVDWSLYNATYAY